MRKWQKCRHNSYTAKFRSSEVYQNKDKRKYRVVDNVETSERYDTSGISTLKQRCFRKLDIYERNTVIHSLVDEVIAEAGDDEEALLEDIVMGSGKEKVSNRRNLYVQREYGNFRKVKYNDRNSTKLTYLEDHMIKRGFSNFNKGAKMLMLQEA